MAKNTPKLARALTVCALGYFIDVFDIQLFAVLRVPSLTELGVASDRISVVGGHILNAQMFGMIVGAFLWGWLGDKVGRVKSLYGSILIYSIGTLACSMVHGVVTYGMLRFFTGFGLAGETGVAITLISELMSAKRRTWGVALISGIGALGPVAAVIVSMFVPWRMVYIVAGILGLVLFGLRVKLFEPGLFQNMQIGQSERGALRLLLRPKKRTYLLWAVLVGLPLTYTWFLLNFFSSELSHTVLRAGEAFNQKYCLIAFYLGTSLGTLTCCSLSQFFAKRRLAILAVHLLGIGAATWLLAVGGLAEYQMYALYLLIGICGGAWALTTAVASDHFGTNVRASATTLVANALRACSIPVIYLFGLLQQSVAITQAAMIIGAMAFLIGLGALLQLKETHGLDLDYVETLKKAKP